MNSPPFTTVWPAGRLATWLVPPCLVILLVWLGLGGTAWNPHVPLGYSGDALFYMAQSKATLDHGWWWVNTSIGAPIGYQALVFAQNTNIDQALIWIVGRFTRDVALAVNTTWLIMLGLSATTATWGLRRLGASRVSAGATAVLFALSPFAFYSNVAHFSLATYLLPFPATAAVLLAASANDRIWRWKDLSILLAGCLLVGLNYIYFAFFGSLLVAAGTLIGFGRTRSMSLLKAGALCLGVLVSATALNLIPNAVAWRQYGQPQGVQHSAMESEVYGLKIRDLVSPVMNHWFPPFQAWLKAEDAADFPLLNESTNARLGLVATVGWCALVATLMFPASPGPDRDDDVVPAAARLGTVATLVAIVGGLGSVFSLLVSSEIRAYNRISPFISFFALAAVAIWIDRITRGRPRHLRSAIWIVILVVGLADQGPALSDLATDIPVVTPGFRHIETFISDLESRLPDEAMVFQLPLRPYPADAGVEGMRTYDHFRPYLASHRLKWSYPVLTRRQVRWEETVAGLPPADWPAVLARAGFSAILINRFGYADGGETLAATLRSPSVTVLADNDDFIALDLRGLRDVKDPAPREPARP